MNKRVKHIALSLWLVVLISAYFMSLTPVHVYSHNFTKEQTCSHKSNDEKGDTTSCFYYKYISQGQGTSLVSEITFVKEAKSFLTENRAYFAFSSGATQENRVVHKRLRAPPVSV